MFHYLPSDLEQALRARPRRWLVTGSAGFIGSHLVECLLKADQDVVGLDNFSTGKRRNLEFAVLANGERFTFIEGDTRDRRTCEKAIRAVDVVLHQAALGSVPRSIDEPLTTHEANVDGFLNMLDAARRAGTRRFVYAASSSTYGDEPTLPKREDRIGAPLSPYAVTKLINELYAQVYARTYDFKATGLRYFNVFGPRQDPAGAYAAVIPAWTAAMIRNQEVTIFGDGETSRDFCFVANAVQANIRAALAPDDVQGRVYNVAVGEGTSLSDLFGLIRDTLALHQAAYDRAPSFAAFREGDVRHSLADIGRARDELGYAPSHTLAQGLVETMPSYLAETGRKDS